MGLGGGSSHTSKTCGICGYILENLGGKKVFKCPMCGLEMDRDLQGVRNVYLRTLVDTPAIINKIL
ncbi:MAG: zinc ribbon domain-containing protein [Candidatus Eremiobacterota bacterium]